MYFSFISKDVIILGVLNVDFRKFCNTKNSGFEKLDNLWSLFNTSFERFCFSIYKASYKIAFVIFGNTKGFSCLISQGIKVSSLFEFNKCSFKIADTW